MWAFCVFLLAWAGLADFCWPLSCVCGQSVDWSVTGWPRDASHTYWWLVCCQHGSEGKLCHMNLILHRLAWAYSHGVPRDPHTEREVKPQVQRLYKSLSDVTFTIVLLTKEVTWPSLATRHPGREVTLQKGIHTKMEGICGHYPTDTSFSFHWFYLST